MLTIKVQKVQTYDTTEMAQRPLGRTVHWMRRRIVKTRLLILTDTRLLVSLSCEL
jgi:hypothetical protein